MLSLSLSLALSHFLARSLVYFLSLSLFLILFHSLSFCRVNVCEGQTTGTLTYHHAISFLFSFSIFCTISTTNPASHCRSCLCISDKVGASVVISPTRWKEWTTGQPSCVGQHVAIHDAVDCVAGLRDITQKRIR